MKLLLVNPKLPESFWSFRWAIAEVLPGRSALNPPLGLATVAALCPPDWQVTIVDENVEPLPLEPDADLIGVCGMGVQSARQKQLLRYYRNAGYFTVAGGSYASLCPEEYAGVADAVVAGEAEYIWPRFCADFARGAAQPLYRETGNVSLADSPLPRFDLLKLERYATATLQLSRGCPYRCDFCDIIVMFGRRPRYKSTAQIERELDALRARGVRKVFFVDDNFIGNKAVAKEVLRFLADYQARHGRRMRFGTEASLNLADDEELMRLFRAAGFEWAFVGLETPDPQALLEANKTQNTKGDMLASVRRLYANGIDILAGFIIGFDRDTPATFELQRRFIVDSGIMVAMVGLLTALPKTPLFERLRKEGRLVEGVPHGDNTKLRTNVLPKNMTSAEMIAGYQRLYVELLADRAIARRVRNKLRYFGAQAQLQRESLREALQLVWNLLRRGIARGGLARIWHFARSLPWLRPHLAAQAINDWIAGLAMRDYADRHFRAQVMEAQRASDASPLEQARAAALAHRTAQRAARLRLALRRWSEQSCVRVLLDRKSAVGDRISVRITGSLDRALTRRLRRQLRVLLKRTQAKLVLAVEASRDIESCHLQRLIRSLERYGDRVAVVVGSGLRDLLRVESAEPAVAPH
jgi:radical SAM superfamily enzyme YgiQ (UPF0313 family)